MKDRLALVGSGCLVFVVIFGGMIAFSSWRDTRKADEAFRAEVAARAAATPTVRAVPPPAPRAVVAKEPEPQPDPPMSATPPRECVLTEHHPIYKTLDEIERRVAHPSEQWKPLGHGSFKLTTETRCEVLNLSGNGAFVRLLDGADKGKRGWINARALAPK
jgi:hypothetical protein